MKSLPDYLRSGLDIISVGLNPSIVSARRGFYFATEQNRFWKALNASRLVEKPLTPGPAAMDVLFESCSIGFTDVVKRPTSGLADLKAADFRRWSPQLRQKLLRYQPRIVWFHGKVAYEKYLRYGVQSITEMTWGQQSQEMDATIFFVTPNPSPANAAFSLEVITDWYNRLADLKSQL